MAMFLVKLVLLAGISEVLFEFAWYFIYNAASVFLAGGLTFGLPFAVIGCGYLLITCNP
jgi:hypothetical protein